jgi:hypothetical protein
MLNQNRATGVRNGNRMPPKYTTGLGDGHVEDSSSHLIHHHHQQPTNTFDDDDEMMVQKVIKARLRNRQNQQQQQRLRNNKNRDNTNNNNQRSPETEDVDTSNDPSDVTVIFPDSNGKNSNNKYVNSNENNPNFRGYTGTGSTSSRQIPLMINTKIHTSTAAGIRRSPGKRTTMMIHPNDPWEAPAIYFVAATVIVVVSAVVVHLIAIGNNNNSSSSGSHHHHNKQSTSSDHSSNTMKKQRQKVLRKKYSIIKKEDGYNEDAKDEDDIPNDSTRPCGATTTTTTISITTAGSSSNGMSDSERTTVLDDVTRVSHPLSYYNNNSNSLHNSPSYHPKPVVATTGITTNNNRLQQQSQHRHRKNSATTTAATYITTTDTNIPTCTTVASTLVPLPPPPPPPPLLIQQQQLSTAASNVVGNRNSNHYHHSNNNAVVPHSTFLATKSPMMHHRTISTAATTSVQHHPTIGYCPPSPMPPRIIATNTNQDVTLITGVMPPAQQLLHTHQSVQPTNNQVILPSFSSESQQHRPATTLLNARPLSSSKLSFESLLTDGNNSSFDEIEDVMNCTTPQNNYNRNVVWDGQHDLTTSGATPKPQLRGSQDAVLMTPKMGLPGNKCIPVLHDGNLIDQTPRIINGSGKQQQHHRYPSLIPQHPPVPEESPLHNLDLKGMSLQHQQHLQNQQHNLQLFNNRGIPMMPPPPLVGTASNVNTQIDLSFAQSPKVREQDQRLVRTTFTSTYDRTKTSTTDPIPSSKSPNRQQCHYSQQQHQLHPEMNKNEAVLMPFVPNLSIEHQKNAQHHQHRSHLELPPQSVNVDQLLHLDRSIESGNISYWAEQIVSKESQQIQNRIFPGGVTSNNNIRDSVLEASNRGNRNGNESESPDSKPSTIPSNDPRKGIHHKRGDLTDFTDSAASLQGSIDFSELKLVEVIGGGGFGQVWKASWRGTPVAVKVLTGSAQSKHVPRPVLEEFAAEINLLKGMRHPNICLYMGACLEPPNRAIITELAANGSLWDALRLPLTPPYVPCDGVSRAGWPDTLYVPDERYGAPPTFASQPRISIPPKGTWHWVLVKRVAFGAARGLSYLHGGKIPVLHRDLKSANILLDESYTAKVCDFGLSRLKAQERSMTGNCGTVQWMVRILFCVVVLVRRNCCILCSN